MIHRFMAMWEESNELWKVVDMDLHTIKTGTWATEKAARAEAWRLWNATLAAANPKGGEGA